MSSRMCPACGAQYLAWVTRCADCGVALLDAGPSVLDLPDDEQLVYELGEWTPARRTLLESLLGADGKPRAELFIPGDIHMLPAGYVVWKSVIAPVVVPAEKPFEHAQ